MLDRDELLPLARRVMNHVRAGTTDQSDRVVRVPTDHYVDSERWQREIDVIFKRRPLGLALSCELPQPGAYKATDVLGVPVLITRGADGVARERSSTCAGIEALASSTDAVRPGDSPARITHGRMTTAVPSSASTASRRSAR